jgi:hypothetical protein
MRLMGREIRQVFVNFYLTSWRDRREDSMNQDEYNPVLFIVIGGIILWQPPVSLKRIFPSCFPNTILFVYVISVRCDTHAKYR